MTTAAAAAPTHAIGGSVGGVPPYIWTACTNAGCPAYQVRRQVWLKHVAAGVVAMPALHCAACAWALPYSIHSPLEGDSMPKIHNGRGPTDKRDIPSPAPTLSAASQDAPPQGATEPDTAVNLVEQEPATADETAVSAPVAGSTENAGGEPAGPPKAKAPGRKNTPRRKAG